MAKKKKHVRSPRGSKRLDLVLEIVRTDSTFSLHDSGDWVGKCIHCNSKLVVDPDGMTSATIEHIDPLCNDGSRSDVRNLALACSRCNNEKGIRHDRRAGCGGRADDVIAALQARRNDRWRDAVVFD